jgi:hypothetical protein
MHRFSVCSILDEIRATIDRAQYAALIAMRQHKSISASFPQHLVKWNEKPVQDSPRQPFRHAAWDFTNTNLARVRYWRRQPVLLARFFAGRPILLVSYVLLG